LIGSLALTACRAAPIPDQQRYPAGTPLVLHTVVLGGTPIRFIDAGRGPAVILVHGLGASMYSWRHTIAPVASAGFRVIAYDNRGFGASGKPDGGYTNRDYATLLVALMDSLHIADAVLVGHSMGGAIAAEVTLSHPGRVRGLVLIDAAGFGVRWPFMLRVARWPIIGPLFDHLRGRGATAGILKAMYADPRRVSERDVDQYYAPVAEPAFGHVLRRVLRDFRFDALRNRIDSLPRPTLVVWGSRDRLIPARVGQAIVAALGQAAFVLIPDGGHAPQEEAPDQVNRALIAYLTQGLPRAPMNLALARGTR